MHLWYFMKTKRTVLLKLSKYSQGKCTTIYDYIHITQMLLSFCVAYIYWHVLSSQKNNSLKKKKTCRFDKCLLLTVIKISITFEEHENVSLNGFLFKSRIVF